MKSKGFTLVELLAVIVVLSIIALIGYSTVGNIISSSQDSSDKITIKNYAEAVDQAVFLSEMNNKVIDLNNYEWLEENVKFEKSTVKCNSIIYDKSSNLYSCKVNNSDKTYCYINNEVMECDESTLIYREPLLNGNDPNLLNNSLTPVVYDEAKSSWVVADTATEWYNYSNQEWANAVILNSGVTKNVGDVVTVPTRSSTTSDIKAMFVWIPRYEYHIEGTYGIHLDGTAGTKDLPGQIEINFIPRSQTTADNGYILHSAFTWDTNSDEIISTSEHISGIWVGKFKMTGTIDAPSVLPNTAMVRKQNLKNQFTASQMFSEFLSDGSNVNSHIMKDPEWGAMAYLSQSIYGKYGNANYTGKNKAIYKNTSTATGRSTGSYIGESYVCVYDNIIDRGNGTGSCGGGASTTGNITGIYDASGDQGGVYEYTMGYYASAKDAQIWTNAGFSEPLEKKYVNAYTIKVSNGVIKENLTTSSEYSFLETVNWYNQYASFGSIISTWLTRGSGDTDKECSGIFAVNLDDGKGIVNAGVSSRPTLLLES